ncbi:hypothetical protein [Streptomyces werraensis]|uniref:hypothetical protein n=1 Tax=Streptomyces werraensis TaxID=68284 RepID=UPI00381E438C
MHHGGDGPMNLDAVRDVPAKHANAGALLSGHEIDVPDAFTAGDLAFLEEAGAGGRRPRGGSTARRGGRGSDGGQVAQFLAGALG